MFNFKSTNILKLFHADSPSAKKHLFSLVSNPETHKILDRMLTITGAAITKLETNIKPDDTQKSEQLSAMRKAYGEVNAQVTKQKDLELHKQLSEKVVNLREQLAPFHTSSRIEPITPYPR